MDMLYLHLRLIQSALGQKAEAEPVGRCPRERSQGRAAMRCHEVASFPGEMELPLGWSLEQVTSFLAKFALSASFATGRDAAHAVSGALIACSLVGSPTQAHALKGKTSRAGVARNRKTTRR